LQELKQLLADSPNDVSLQRLVAEYTQAYAKKVQQAVLAAQQQNKPQQLTEFEEDAAAEQQQVQAATAAGAAEAAAVEPLSQVQHHKILIEETDGSGSESDEEDARSAPAAAAAAQQPLSLQQPSSVDKVQQDANAGPAAAATGAAEQQPASSKPAARAAEVTAAAVPRAAAAATERLVQQLTAKQANPPKTATEFINAAKLLSAAKGGSSQTLGQYVRQLEPAKYKTVFKRELSEGLIRWLVQGLQAIVVQEPEFVAQALLQLSHVERFAMVLPMAASNKATKAALQGLLDKLAAAGQDMAPLKAAYKFR
jgi:hypothetical protein